MSRYRLRHYVPSTTVVMAIRYGMGRMTYADSDARDLVRTHWPDMHPTDQQVVREDIEAHLQLCLVHLSSKGSEVGSHWKYQYGHWRYLLEHLDDEEVPAEPLGLPIYEEMEHA